ncbi:hypothetical protein NM688_g1614 [Phlebia brevispora]|uniref:Uncharacterized protein n=1 Tax=Phlebia brevispora TaxID=194682 RepID=A0ACC1TB06_9APHY|nr:hypothetical protein NM688_g1614 [Phlebia brevispora]
MHASVLNVNTTQDALLADVGVAFIVYLIFKRWEPGAIYMQALLLLLLPAVVSILLLDKLAVWATFAIYYSTILASTLAYRLSPFHPMARYPGPVMCKVSKFWMAYVAKNHKQHLYLQSLHDKYGDVVRIGPNEVSIRDTSAINPLMGSQGLPKGPTWGGRSLQNPIKALIVLQDQAEHLRRRKSWNRGLNIAAIKELAPTMTARITQLVDGIGSQKGAVDLSKWVSFFT